jgi:uncharacterized repeat protein (TIGR03803 family)
MSHVPRNLTARVAALCACATLVGLVASSAEAASRGTLAASPGKPAHKVLRHHRVGAEIFTEQTVYSFQGGSDGTFPWGDLTQAGGALYSTTLNGGANGMGTIFKLTPARGGGFTENIVHAFAGGADGANPWQGVSADLLGSLYGLTSSGGVAGTGTVFKLSTKGEGPLYSFQGNGDGANPTGFPNEDLTGSVYGTTENGGTAGAGTVFALRPNRNGYSEQVLYSFKGGNDAQQPHGGLLEDLLGSLYGTSYFGGTSGAGTVFKLTPSWSGGYNESIIHSFNGTDGSIPNASMIEDWTGTLYGTATWGGTGTCNNSYGGFGGCGTVFKLTPSWNGYTETTLYSFQGGTDGAAPNGGLFKDAQGNLYGTTYYGGANGGGTVFELSPQRNGSYVENVVWSFGTAGDGTHPAGGMIAFGNALYGTTVYGGTINQGTVFSITP